MTVGVLMHSVTLASPNHCKSILNSDLRIDVGRKMVRLREQMARSR